MGYIFGVILMGKFKFTVFLVFALMAFLFNSSVTCARQEDSDLNIEKVQEILKYLLCEYGAQLTATVCHETGHALAYYYLTGEFPKIHIGANSGELSNDKKNNSLLSFGKYSVDGVHPLRGYTECDYSKIVPEFYTAQEKLKELIIFYLKNLNEKKISLSSCDKSQLDDLVEFIKASREYKNFISLSQKTKRAHILLAISGGIAGIIGFLIVKYFVLHIQEKFKNFNLLDTSRNIWDNGTTLRIVLIQLFNILVPFAIGSNESDGTKLWRALGVKEDVLKKNRTALPIL
jgi:hypothetical protein